MTQDEANRVRENIAAVHTYLEEEFNGFEITDKSDAPVNHNFTVLNQQEYKVFKLFVATPRLADENNNPANILRRLRAEQVADKMREQKEDGYSWGR